MKKKYYLYKMNITAISLFSTVLLIILVILTMFIYPIGTFFDYDFKLIPFVCYYFLYIGFHEVLHSLAYVIYGGKYNKIVYGVLLEKGVLYCLCKQNISKSNILHSLMYPLFFIGIVTYVISVIYKLPTLLFLSILNLSGCAGDIIMFNFISRLKNIEFSEMDDPIAFAIYTDEDISKKKSLGLDYIGCEDKIERNDFKKITISKLSWIVIAIIVIGIIVSFI